MIPYGHQSIDKSDIEAIIKVLKSDWLTQGPEIDEFEKKLSEYCGAKYAVVFSNGTAALHAAYFAAGFKKDSEFITTPLTFAATANAGLYLDARPVFADIDEYGNLDPGEIEKKITKKTNAIVAVDYAGRPVQLDQFRAIAQKYDLVLIEDACHALGAEYKGKKIGSVSDMTIFSFHPVKSITTGEGGAALTNDEGYYEKLKLFRTHGITKRDLKNKSEADGDWYYEMQELGFNYRMTDLQAALGTSQLKRLNGFIGKRKEIAKKYERAFKKYEDYLILPPLDDEDYFSAWHLYAIRLKNNNRRLETFKKLRGADIGVQVHYIPVYWHPYYQKLGYKKGICPKAEAFYKSAISLPIYPDLKSEDQEFVIKEITNFLVS